MSSDGDTMTVEILYAPLMFWEICLSKNKSIIIKISPTTPSFYNVTFNVSTDLIFGNVSADRYICWCRGFVR